MRHPRSAVIASLLAAQLTSGASAQDALPKEATLPASPAGATARPAALLPGDPAPALAVDEWIRGAPVGALEKGRVYVVEFWATWCVPCIANMPHLTELQRRFADQGVTVIGVTCADERNTLKEVRRTVVEKGDAIGYAVAWDGRRASWDAWMAAAAQEAIPWSFIVDRDGRVAFIGYPGFMDEPLAQVVAGTHDLAAAARARRDDLEQFRRTREHQAQIEVARTLLVAGERDTGLRVLHDLLEGPARDDVNGLLGIAWALMDLDAALQPDYQLARRAAERATILTKEPNPYALDALAHAWSLSGDPKKAVEVQQRAILCAPAAMKEYLQESLVQYQRAAGGD